MGDGIQQVEIVNGGGGPRVLESAFIAFCFFVWYGPRFDTIAQAVVASIGIWFLALILFYVPVIRIFMGLGCSAAWGYAGFSLVKWIFNGAMLPGVIAGIVLFVFSLLFHLQKP